MDLKVIVGHAELQSLPSPDCQRLLWEGDMSGPLRQIVMGTSLT